MKLTVIGCWGAYPDPGGASSGYLIESEGSGKDDRFLLDCGSGILSKLQEYTDISKLNNVVLSHYHSDHIADIGCLQYAAKVQMSQKERELPISIYGHTLSKIFSKLSFENASLGKAVKEEEPLEIGSFTLTFKHTPHPAPNLAARIESTGKSIGYTGDTGWDDNLSGFFKNVDILLCESSLYNKYKGMVEGHLTAGEAGRLAKDAGVGELILTHLPHSGNHKDLIKEAAAVFNGKIELAESGKTWTC